MKRFRKVYLEISNICNLQCSFCPGTRRQPKVMQSDIFRQILTKLQPWTDYLYFHLMGEPLCHPNLESYLAMARDMGFKVILTTNGTLLAKQQDMLLRSGVHKVNISLHAFEANDLAVSFESYLSDCFRFGQAAQGTCIVSYRLWNHGGAEELNDGILNAMKTFFPDEWVQEPRGIRIGQRIYLEHGDKFDWPDHSAPEGSDRVFCYGLRDQIGVLCDGTVVPCCLDHEGDLSLGNLLNEDLEDILASPRANGIYQGFSKGQAQEELCRKCGYARRFTG
ncbi:MAG: radical SAM protein [Ruminococcaceae bacterium]|nr:radical SAM protein [Oscillospiraceae bacterium]